MRVLLTTAAWR